MLIKLDISKITNQLGLGGTSMDHPVVRCMERTGYPPPDQLITFAAEIAKCECGVMAAVCADGNHRCMSCAADEGYGPGDERLEPVRRQI